MEILKAPKAKDVKTQTRKIYRHEEWEKKNVEVMKKVCLAKVQQVPEVREKLLSTGDRPIAECVLSDSFWSCGLSKEAASNTDPSKWPGENMLGQICSQIRQELRDEMQKEPEFKTVASSKVQNSTPAPKPVKRNLSEGSAANCSAQKE